MPTLEAADTNLKGLIGKGYDIEFQIADLQAKLDLLDQATDAAFRVRNDLAEQHGQVVFRDIDSFMNAVS
ncbi:MAG: hypothetical protein AB7D39_11770 [Pseudodesulfovibrio sp.]|uniref:hypothetical protein n=1 Tax=Pseudodesulfovibrio sp. TaxID=2035812 RepID=UPI003D149503